MQQKNPKLNNKLTGNLGETVAANYLQRNGFVILERNYLKKWGEIDIISRDTHGKIHFVEVKTVSYETKEALRLAISRRTWRPEENVHGFKIQKMHRAIETWLHEKQYTGEWQIDVVAVRIVPREKYATLKFIPNIVIG